MGSGRASRKRARAYRGVSKLETVKVALCNGAGDVEWAKALDVSRGQQAVAAAILLSVNKVSTVQQVEIPEAKAGYVSVRHRTNPDARELDNNSLKTARRLSSAAHELRLQDAICYPFYTPSDPGRSTKYPTRRRVQGSEARHATVGF